MGVVDKLDIDIAREAQIAAMAVAGQRLAVRWGHQPWSDSWARLVAETLRDVAANPSLWKTP